MKGIFRTSLRQNDTKSEMKSFKSSTTNADAGSQVFKFRQSLHRTIVESVDAVNDSTEPTCDSDDSSYGDDIDQMLSHIHDVSKRWEHNDTQQKQTSYEKKQTERISAIKRSSFIEPNTRNSKIPKRNFFSLVVPMKNRPIEIQHDKTRGSLNGFSGSIIKTISSLRKSKRKGKKDKKHEKIAKSTTCSLRNSLVASLPFSRRTKSSNLVDFDVTEGSDESENVTESNEILSQIRMYSSPSHESMFEEYMKCIIYDSVSSSSLHINESGCYFKNRMQNDYSVIMQSYSGNDNIERNLKAATHILRQFCNVTNTMGVYGDTEFGDWNDENIKIRSIQVIFHHMEEFLLTKLSQLYQDMNTLTSKSISDIITWIFKFIGNVKLCCPYGSVAKIWNDDMVKLLDHYTDKYIRPEIKKFSEIITNFMNQTGEVKIYEGSNGALSTTWPEELEEFLLSELDFVRSYFPIHIQKDVLEVCSEELSNLVTNQLKELPIYSESMSLQRLCAIINDSYSMSNLLGAIHDDFFLFQKDCTSKTRLLRKSKQIERQFVDVSIQATNYLREDIFQQIQREGSSLTNIGKLCWEMNTYEFTVRRFVGSLQQHFINIEKWLNVSSCYESLITECVNETLQSYVTAFFANTITTGLRNSTRATMKLRQDYLEFVNFFNCPALQIYYENSYSLKEQDINLRLHVILSISRLIDPCISPEFHSDDARTILQTISIDGNIKGTFLRQLVGLRSNDEANQDESLVWLNIISQTLTDMNNDKKNDNLHQLGNITLPNLFESRYLDQVQVNTNDLQRKLTKSHDTTTNIFKVLHHDNNIDFVYRKDSIQVQRGEIIQKKEESTKSWTRISL